PLSLLSLFFFSPPSPPLFSTLSLHDALPISLSGLLLQHCFGVFQLFVPLTQPVLQFLSPPLEFFNRLLPGRQLAAEFIALSLQVAQLLFKSLAPLDFFPAGSLRFLGRRFRRFQFVF